MDLLFWTTLLLVLSMVQSLVSIEQWNFKPLPAAIDWKRSKIAGYLFQREVVSSLKCAALCAQHEKCTTYFLVDDWCHGTTFLTPDSSKSFTTNLTIYNKRPKNVCDHGDFVYYKGLCLSINHEQKSWHDAETYCKRKGGHLLVLDYESKYSVITEYISTYSPFTVVDIFIGASDLETEGTWKWITPARNYFRFNNGQPNNRDADYDITFTKAANCGALIINRGELHDEICEQTNFFVCEM